MRSENSNEVLGSHYRASMAIDDGSSIDIIPPHMSPDVSSFHGTATTSDHDWMTTRLSEDDLHDTLENSTESTRVENEVMREVTRWVQAYHCDDFWMPRNKGYQPALPTANQILERQLHMTQHGITPSCHEMDAFESLLNAIALQLLASCRTVLPASSASHLPLFQQRKESMNISALCLHARQRFSPAAGHQARPPSETAAWPGLHEGPSPEDQMVETLARRRRLNKRSGALTPFLTASGWTDGPASARASNSDSRRTHSRGSSERSVEANFFSRLICQPSLPKNPRRKQNTLFLSRLSSKRRKQKSQPTNRGKCDSSEREARLKPLQHLTAQAMQRIPSAFRLRQTQSAPRITSQEAASLPVMHDDSSRRRSSNPSIGSPLSYAFELPEIRRMSVTPVHGKHPQEVIQGSVRACGRGDLLAAHEDFDFAFRNGRQVDQIQDQNLYSSSHAYISRCSLSPSATSGVSPYSAARSAQSRSPTDYFSDVCCQKDFYDQTYPLGDVQVEPSEAGPHDDDPRLPKMFMLKNEDYSDESFMAMSRKRKSLVLASSEAEEAIKERFKPHSEEKPPD